MQVANKYHRELYVPVKVSKPSTHFSTKRAILDEVVQGKSISWIAMKHMMTTAEVRAWLARVGLRVH